MKVSDPIKRAVPFCLCLCILCCLLPAIAAISGSTASIKLCILSDLHYLAAADQAAADGNEWRLYGESAPATEEAIEAVIRQRPDVLLLTGDLTSGAGRASAEELAQKLQKVEQAGIRVFVINGESDMSGGLSPAEFRDIFHAYGYDGADSAAYYQPQPSEEAVQGSLSYAVTPKPGIRLLMIASKTGGGLTSLPANEATLSARIERAIKTWQGELPKSEQGYVFVLEDSETGTVAGICAIEVAVGLNDPWYNYRVGTLVHASKELNVYNALPTLFLSNDHTGSSELCTLFLDPDWRKEGNGYLLSKSRFMFMAAFRDKFNDKVVAEMRGVIDEHGYSPFWQSLGKRFFSMDFSRADFLCGTGQKAFIAELMPKHPIYTHFLSQEAQDVIGQVHPQTAPARAVLEKEGFRYRNYIDIFDGGPTLECDIDRVRAIRKSRQVEVAEGQPAQGDFPACLVANENYHHFRVVLVRTDPATERLILTAAQLDALKCHAGDRVRLVRLCAEEKTA